MVLGSAQPHPAPYQVIEILDKNIPHSEDVKDFFRVARQVRTRIVDLQDALSSTTESVYRAADLMDTDMQDGIGKILERTEHARKLILSASRVKESVASSIRRRINPFSRTESKEEKVNEKETYSAKKETAHLDLENEWQTLKQTEKELEGYAKTIEDSLGQVLSLIQVELPFGENLKFPKIASNLKNMADDLKATAMEQLNQLADDLITSSIILFIPST